MGEEEKKKPAAEGKKEDGAVGQQKVQPAEEKKAGELVEKNDQNKEPIKKASEETEAEAAALPQEIEMRVYMHCEGCARKVRRSLKGFDGVEEVITECKSHKVIVKGERADPLKVLQRVQKKSHRQVQLLSPLPKPPEETPPKPPTEDPPKPPPEEKKQEVITVVLKVHMHCEACAQEIKKRILRMQGVESAEAELKSSEVAVKGVMEPQKLVDYVYKRTGKHAVIVKQDPDQKKPEEATAVAEEKKKGACEEDKKGGDDKKDGSKKDESSNVADQAKKGGGEGDQAVEEEERNKVQVAEVLKMKNEYYYTYPPPYNYTQKYAAVDMYPMTYHPAVAYPPQIFSDENPNACSVM